MSVSKISICNMALSHIGSSRINALTDPSEPARLCNLMYDPSREFVLQDHDWGFAEVVDDLALIDETPVGYTYAYQYPVGCLQFKELYQSSTGAKPLDYIIRSNATLTNRKILTEESEAVGMWTGNVTNTNMFSAAFVMAFSYQLASLIALPITKKTSIRDKMLQYYDAYMSKAQLLDAQQMNYSVEQNNDFLESRGYTG
jgi:hypothetical protein